MLQLHVEAHPELLDVEIHRIEIEPDLRSDLYACSVVKCAAMDVLFAVVSDAEARRERVERRRRSEY